MTTQFNRNVRDLHLVLIHSLLLPQMISILDPSYHEMSMEVTSLPTVFVGKPTVNPKSGVTDRQYVGRTKMNASLVHCFDVIEKEFLLRRYAVGTLGMLFRSITGDSSNR